MWSTLFLFIFVSTQSYAQEECPETHDGPSIANTLCLFSHPLITGASVSHGEGANAGGAPALISKKLNPGAEIKTIAKSNTAFGEYYKEGKFDDHKSSIVFGIDLFFWDAARGKCDAEFRTLAEKFFAHYQSRKIPMIIGNLPKGLDFPKGYRKLNDAPCTNTINQMISELCNPEKNCLVYETTSCFRALEKKADELYGVGPSASKTDYLEKKKKEFYVDDYHPSVAGNEFCTEEFLRSAEYQKLHCAP